jgi:inositol-1,3,4-trisphosphate 5/6-kinase/inositol-tetrakisphosphate 1-kinase
VNAEFPNVHYDSHDISKPHSASELNELDEEDEKRREVHELKKKKLDRIVNVLRRKLQLCLFGIDVIIEDQTGRYAIIDMNSFPGE